MDYTARLRRVALNDVQGESVQFDGACAPGAEVSPRTIDPRTLALARLAALVAVGGAHPSFGEQVDDAIGAGASADEIVDVLAGVISIVGLPAAVAAAPKLAMALGFPLDEEPVPRPDD